MRSISLTTLLLFGSLQTVSAFDFGSAIQTVAPATQPLTPIVDAKLTSNPLIKNITITLGVTPTQAVGRTAAFAQ